MFFALTNSIKKRLVLVFQDIFAEHPIFNKVEVFTKFPEKERPKFALMIRSASATSQKLSLDNFVRNNEAYSTLANLKGVNGGSIEWVRDDAKHIDKMSAPGFYICTMVAGDQLNPKFKFVVDPYLVVEDEELDIIFIQGHEGAILKNLPVNPNTEIITAIDAAFDFKPGIDYTINYATGEIIFTNSVKEYGRIIVDYQVLSKRTGPFDADYYMTNNTAIPGVVLAFGDMLKKGDEQVVVIESERTQNAKVYGGRWNLSLDLVAVSQDPDQQERMIDYVVTKFWANYQNKLTDEGIHIKDFSLSGEAEDLEVEIPEEYSFTAGLSFVCDVDWELHVPLISKIRRVNVNYGEMSYRQTIDNKTEDQYVLKQFDSRMVNSQHQVGLEIVAPLDPIITNPTCIGKVQTKKWNT